MMRLDSQEKKWEVNKAVASLGVEHCFSFKNLVVVHKLINFAAQLWL